MKRWIVGLLLLAVGIALAQGQTVGDDDADYEIKRFHVQSRQLDGRPHCYMTRRKRSAEELRDEEADYLGAPINFEEENDEQEEEEEEQEENDEEDYNDEDSSRDLNENPTGLLISDSELQGEGGILVIQNGGPSSQPLLFQIRPTDSHTDDSYLRIGDENDPDAEDESYENDDDGSVAVYNSNNNNRVRPSSSLKPFTDSDSESDENLDNAPPKRRVTKRKPSSSVSENQQPKRKKKPKRPTKRPPTSQKKPNRKKKPNQNQNNNKTKSKKKKKKSSNKSRVQVYQNLHKNQHRNNFKRKVNNNTNRNKKVAVSLNKGSGTNTVTNTVTTTHTGTGADNPDVNCIIINKSPSTTTEAPFWGLLGRNADDNGADRSFGLRKRVKQLIG